MTLSLGDPAKHRVLDLDHVVLHVADLDRSAAFYMTVLGAERVELNWGRVGLRFGAGRQINLHGPDSTPQPVPDRIPRPGSGDICFAWSGTAETAAAHLRAHGITPETGPVERTGARGPGTSVYFRDPDGSLLELLAY